jgi:hypothetical protein
VIYVCTRMIFCAKQEYSEGEFLADQEVGMASSRTNDRVLDLWARSFDGTRTRTSVAAVRRMALLSRTMRVPFLPRGRKLTQSINRWH